MFANGVFHLAQQKGTQQPFSLHTSWFSSLHLSPSSHRGWGQPFSPACEGSISIARAPAGIYGIYALYSSLSPGHILQASQH